MTDPANPFTLRLASSADFPGKRLVGLETRIETGPAFSDAFSLIEKTIGETIPQGSLFAYLVRRFGFPNTPSDPHKNLASFLLTTSHPEMLMRITPYAGGDTDISFSFMTTNRIASDLSRWPFRARDAHRDAFPAWLTENDLLPEWMEEAQEEAARAGYCAPDQPVGSLTQTLRMLDMDGYVARRNKEDAPRLTWLEEARQKYEREHPEPPVQRRQESWQDWPEDDPMKPFAEAIATTLTELTRPVWVRDCPIDPWGLMSDDDAIDRLEKLDDALGEESETPVAEIAGYPVGALANRDPEGFSDLMSLVQRLGKDNIEEGFAKAFNILNSALANETEDA